MNVRLPTRVDRYPAKMVSRLADRLIHRYADGAATLLDPFAGSGAILVAGKRHGIAVSGADINPISALFTRVKLDGFEAKAARRLLDQVLKHAEGSNARFDIRWPEKTYWFTARTIDKFEAIRAALLQLSLPESAEKIAVLLCVSLAVRTCSRADQRSPKPFISKRAIATRRRVHFDPMKIVSALLDELSTHYGSTIPVRQSAHFLIADLAQKHSLSKLPFQSRIITSPPYLNAQDYFRNFKLELYILEDILPFRVDELKNRFIGTERGLSQTEVSRTEMERLATRLPILERIYRKSPHNAAVVGRYFIDMGRALRTMRDVLQPGGVLVIVCGDNMVAGERIKTWKMIAAMVEDLGLNQFDSFADPIKDRLLAPKRLGHIGLIKEEIVMAFRKQN